MEYLSIEAYLFDLAVDFLTLKATVYYSFEGKQKTAFLLYWSSSGNFPVVQMGFDNCFYAIKSNKPKLNKKTSLYSILTVIQAPLCEACIIMCDKPDLSIYTIVVAPVMNIPYSEIRLEYSDYRNLSPAEFPNPYIFPLPLPIETTAI